MNAIKTKLRSQRGASITFALLLFLVCAVVSSIVIVAATTASGRMSSLPDIDQRYYAVSSAVELLGTTLNDKAVTVVKSQTVTTETTYNFAGDVVGTPSIDEGTGVDTQIYAGEEVSEAARVLSSNYSLLTSLANTLTNDILTDVDNNPLTESTATYPDYVKHELTVQGGDLEDSALKMLGVNVYQKLEADGTLTFYVAKEVGEGMAYTMRMIFAADKTENTMSHIDHGAPILTDAEDGYSITDTETKTVTILYRWTLTRVEKSIIPAEFTA